MLSRMVTQTGPLLFMLFLLYACTTLSADISTVKDGPVQILGTLNGDLPVSSLKMLPVELQEQPVGYLSSQKQLDVFLQSIQADGTLLPVVDFSSQIILFAKNTVYYNRLSIGQVFREGETLTILAMETRSAMPVTDKVAISLVIIERNGAMFIDAGNTKVTIEN